MKRELAALMTCLLIGAPPNAVSADPLHPTSLSGRWTYEGSRYSADMHLFRSGFCVVRLGTGLEREVATCTWEASNEGLVVIKHQGAPSKSVELARLRYLELEGSLQAVNEPGIVLTRETWRRH